MKWVDVGSQHTCGWCHTKTIQMEDYSKDEARPRSNVFRCNFCEKTCYSIDKNPRGLCDCETCINDFAGQEHTQSDEPQAPEGAESFGQWCILELMGHRRLAGYVTEAQFPAGHLRIDVPALPDRSAFTSTYNPSAIYALHPVSEETALAVARTCSQKPVTEFDVSKLIEARSGDREEEYEEGECY